MACGPSSPRTRRATSHDRFQPASPRPVPAWEAEGRCPERASWPRRPGSWRSASSPRSSRGRPCRLHGPTGREPAPGISHRPPQVRRLHRPASPDAAGWSSPSPAIRGTRPRDREEPSSSSASSIRRRAARCPLSSLAGSPMPAVPSSSAVALRDADASEVVAGTQLELGVSWSNWCGAAPVEPLTLEIRLAGDDAWIPMIPPVGSTILVPPCMGSGQPAALNLTGFQPSDRPPIEG